jgi:hypothetical protein
LKSCANEGLEIDTITNLAGFQHIQPTHLAEALQ